MQELFKFFKGYVIIKVIGNFPERFLNLAAHKKIYIWDVRRVGENVYIMKMSVKAFLSLKKVAFLSGCRVSVIAKKGILFKIKSIKNLYAILVGIIIFSTIIVFSSGRITDIYIEGNETLTYTQIEQRLEKSGLKRWMSKKAVDVEKIVNKFRIENDDISYIAVNLHGTKAYVQIAEASPKPEIVDPNAPCNIVSDVDGVIETIRVKTGFQVAKEGETVRKGQLLVSGITDSRFVTVRYVNSDAEIIVRTWRDFCKEFPLTRKVCTKTGNISETVEIIAGNKVLKEAKTEFKNYSKDVHTIKTINFLTFNKVVFHEENVRFEKMSLEKAFTLYYDSFLNEIKNNLGKEITIVSVRHNYAEDNGKVRIWIELETLEKSGIKARNKKGRRKWRE